MTGQIESGGASVGSTMPDVERQLAQVMDVWIREWRACLCDVNVIEGGISLSQTQFFREPPFEQLAQDEGFPPHLRLDGPAELSGARKMLQRLLVGNPDAMRTLAGHLAAAEGRAS